VSVHDEIAAVCGKNRVAFAIHFDSLRQAVAASFQAFNDAQPCLPIPNTNDLVASPRIAPTPVHVTPDGVDIGPTTIQVAVHPRAEPAEVLGRIDCAVPRFPARLAFVRASLLGLVFPDPGKAPTAVTKQTAGASPGQLAKYFSGLQADYEDLMRSVRVTLRSDTAPELLKIARLPDYLKCLAFTMLHPRVEFAPHHVLLLSGQIAGPLATGGEPACPKGPDADFEVEPSPSIAPAPGQGQPSFSGTVTQTVPPLPALSRWSEAAPYLLYLPRLAFKGLADAALKPAVMASDQGRVGLAQWEYSASAGLETDSVQVAVDVSGERVKVDARFDVAVAAGTQMTLGCTDIRLAGAAISGLFAPSAWLRICHDRATGDVTLFSELARGDAELRLNIPSPSAPFPLDEVMPCLLESVAENVLREKAVALLNALRVRLCNASALARLAAGGQELDAVARHALPESVLVALTADSAAAAGWSSGTAAARR
jgi:hypothetical protein